MKIPFNKIYYEGRELTYIKDSMERESISGDGYYTQLVTDLFKEKIY